MNDRLDKAIRAAAANIVEAAPPPPLHPVAAARQRHKIPFWVLPALVLLPVLGFLYVRALASETAVEPGPLGVTLAELIFAITHEGAADVDDLLDRRTRVGLVAEDRAAALPMAERAFDLV